MKVSIVTVSYNAASTIASTIESVLSQTHNDIEYIIVDGKSKDDTMAVVERYKDGIAKYVSEKDNGLYDAINKGIAMATGDIVGILNADDFFVHQNVVKNIVDAFNQDTKLDAVIADIAFVNPNRLDKVVRYYSSKGWKPGKFGLGFMPPHPSFYVKRELYKQLGDYKPDYKICADYELLIRFIYVNKVRYKYIDDCLVYMRTGGVSNSSIKSRYVLNQEIVRACKENGISTNMFILSLKYFRKVFEVINPVFASKRVR
ncbi:glycosyltransferase family 2 protein [Chitinophaga sp. Hz27]|uniref:glycosyltransferase family 2 protein n=1 Tax=Chitinophaga sp. Hz27 TaxID=3347169 RepID=UPI0035D6E0AF